MSNQKETGKENFTGTGGGDIRILIEDLSETVTNITKAGFRTIILIDALNKVDDIGKTNKVINLTSCLTENWSYETNNRNSESMNPANNKWPLTCNEQTNKWLWLDENYGEDRYFGFINWIDDVNWQIDNQIERRKKVLKVKHRNSWFNQ